VDGGNFEIVHEAHRMAPSRIHDSPHFLESAENDHAHDVGKNRIRNSIKPGNMTVGPALTVRLRVKRDIEGDICLWFLAAGLDAVEARIAGERDLVKVARGFSPLPVESPEDAPCGLGRFRIDDGDTLFKLSFGPFLSPFCENALPRNECGSSSSVSESSELLRDAELYESKTCM
jgi:hypothetical protein